MTGPDACARASPRGKGAGGMTPAAWVEAWVWALEPLRVTFGGVGPRGSREWKAAVWHAISVEAARRAAEEEAG